MIRVIASILLIVSAAVLSHTVVQKKATAIEANISAEANRLLKARELSDVRAVVSGRDVALEGSVSQQQDRALAADLVDSVPGVHSVVNRVSVKRGNGRQLSNSSQRSRPAVIRPQPARPNNNVKPTMAMPAPKPAQTTASARVVARPVVTPAPVVAKPAPAVKPAPVIRPTSNVIKPPVAPKPVITRPVVRPVNPSANAAPSVVSSPLSASGAAASAKAVAANILPVSANVPKPYVFTLTGSNRQARASGFLPNDKALEAVRRQVTVTEFKEVRQATGAPINFDKAAVFAAMAVNKLKTGSAKISDQQIAINGVYDGTVNTFIDQIEPALPNGYTFTVQVNSALSAVSPSPLANAGGRDAATKKPASAPLAQTIPVSQSVTSAEGALPTAVTIAPSPVSDQQLKQEALGCQTTIDRVMSGRNIEFGFGSAELGRTSMGLLDKVTNAMFECPGAYLYVTGHTDSRGSTDRNLQVSAERANAVRNYLVAAGMYAANIIAEGRGSSDPIAANTTERGRARNRRIEFLVRSEPK